MVTLNEAMAQLDEARASLRRAESMLRQLDSQGELRHEATAMECSVLAKQVHGIESRIASRVEVAA